jgi:hypothetical protein
MVSRGVRICAILISVATPYGHMSLQEVVHPTPRCPGDLHAPTNLLLYIIAQPEP